MVYPNLLFYSTQENNKIPEEVFLDIKLDALLPGDVFGVMSVFCDEQNIKYRQELFRVLLDDNDALSHFNGLLDLINSIYELDKRYSEDISIEEKTFIFLAITRRIIEFSEKVVSKRIEGSKLLDRFIDSFVTYTETDEFKAIKNECLSLRTVIEDFDSFSFIIQGENLKVVTGKDESFTQRLIVCAQSLELKTEYHNRMFTKELSTPIISAFCRMNMESYSKIKDFYQKHSSFYEREIVVYKEQIEFYVNVSKLINRIKERDIPIIYPFINSAEKKICISDAYDISLIAKNQSFIIPNDIDFSDKYVFVGPSIRMTDVEFKKNREKLIYISLGTVMNDNVKFFKNCIKALKDTDYQVIMSVGNLVSIEEFGVLPENISVFTHVDQIAVLQQADVFVSHCGMNSVSESLYFGVPLVMLPQTSEQGGVAERVFQLGAGIKLDKSDAVSILGAIRKIFADSSYTQNAAVISESFTLRPNIISTFFKILSALAGSLPTRFPQRTEASSLILSKSSSSSTFFSTLSTTVAPSFSLCISIASLIASTSSL
mgnify:CR=1 FL=1